MQQQPEQSEIQDLARHGLYSPTQEHDACGVGFVAHIKGHKSHDIVRNGLLILKNLDHRGAVGADKLMGDGAGILLQIPDAYYRAEMGAQGVELPPPGEYGVGMIFLPRESASRLACEQEIERAVRAEGQQVLGWRDVPVDRDMPMSPTVRAKEPVIRQIFIGRGPDVMVTDALERKLFVIRRVASHAIQRLNLRHGREYFVPSMSARTVGDIGMSRSTGTSRQPSTCCPSARTARSISCSQARRDADSRGRKIMPTPYSPGGGSSTPCAAISAR